MTKTEMTIYSIIGAGKHDISPLSIAVDLAIELLFQRGIAMDDIFITKDIYPAVALATGKTKAAAAKQVERLSNLCWDLIQQAGAEEQYIGKTIQDIRAPSNMVFYLAFFIHFDEPFFKVIEKQPALLF